jgi:hypothetical protein
MAERSSRREGTRGRLGRKKAKAESKATPSGQDASTEQVSLQLIADKLDRLTWRHSLLGVDEREVWHVVQRLDEMYRQLYREQQVHYEALLQQARGEAPGGSPTESGRQGSVQPSLPGSLQATDGLRGNW